jgi:type F conjugative transfer system protein TrbI
MTTKRTLAVMTAALALLMSAAMTGAPATPSLASREITVPAGTILPLVLDSYIASDQSRNEDPVRAHVRRNVVIGDLIVIPAGSAVSGYVTNVARSGRVKGRARVAFTFNRLSVRDANSLRINTSAVSRQAPATKSKDAAIIGLPAAGGAIVGAVTGGKKGAAIGAAAGGGAGTAVVLSTRGKEVRLGRGYQLGVRLLSPITIRVPVRAD